MSEDNEPLIYKDTNDEKICRNCLHYSFGECDIDGEYTGEEWFCDLWE